MGDSDFALGFGVIEQGCKAIPNANIHVITGDTRRGSVQNVFRPEQVSIVGGGGTDMTPLIIEAAAEKPRPDIIFVLTDGYTPWPSEPVGCKVVACITRNESGEGIPDWIPSVELRPEGMEDY
jgi:predicted metal-dependent peptidase